MLKVDDDPSRGPSDSVEEDGVAIRLEGEF